MFSRVHIASAAGAVLLGAILLFVVFRLSVQNPHTNTDLPTPPITAASTLPTRLSIPTIRVNAAIEPTGLTPEGAMGVPKDPEGVAWYELGPHPGETGSAVIAGHIGWKDGTQAAFDTLAFLRPGDKLYVEDAAGATITFVVREQRMYDQNQDASAVFNSFDGKAHLNLIGCEGVWSAVTKSYSKRLVVFTDRVMASL